MATAAELLDQLLNGETTADEIATKEFPFVEWPEPRERAKTLDEVEANPDPEPFEPGGFEIFAQAYTDGKIAEPDYTVLAQGYADVRA